MRDARSSTRHRWSDAARRGAIDRAGRGAELRPTCDLIPQPCNAGRTMAYCGRRPRWATGARDDERRSASCDAPACRARRDVTGESRAADRSGVRTRKGEAMVVHGPGFRHGLLALMLLALCACSQPQPGSVVDEAKLAGRDAASFPQAAEDYFHDMDNGVALTPDEVKGRNMWLVWSGGNDRFWDQMTDYTFGAFDLLKIVSSHPGAGLLARQPLDSSSGWSTSRASSTPTGPDPARFGLWLDVRGKDCAADPFENEAKYPGVADRRARQGPRRRQDAAGRLVLRLCDRHPRACGCSRIPTSTRRPRRRWDPERYYTDPSYYNRKDLVRPYRVGMSCGFCHVGPSPVHPPADPEHPAFANLSSSVGAQYMWVDRLFIFNSNKPEGQRNFMFQLAHTYRPGTMDTSLVSTDSINNPRTMNAVYDVRGADGHGAEDRPREARRRRARQQAVQRLHRRRPADDVLVEGHRDRRDAARAEGRRRLGRACSARSTASTSTSACSARSGCCTSTRSSAARRSRRSRSPTRRRTRLLAGDRGRHAGHRAVLPEGRAARPAEGRARRRGLPDRRRRDARARQGRVRRHLRALPLEQGAAAAADARPRRDAAPAPATSTASSATGRGRRPTTTSAQMRAIVAAPDFLDGNYLSTDARIRSTLLRTNACSPLATNALARQHLGQLLVADVQAPAVGRHRHGVRPVHRRADAVRDAGRRPRLHARAVARSACGRRRRTC